MPKSVNDGNSQCPDHGEMGNANGICMACGHIDPPAADAAPSEDAAEAQAHQERESRAFQVGGGNPWPQSRAD